MDGQLLLRDMLESAVGEPPRRISAESVRHRAARRRGTQAIVAAAAAIAVTAAGVAATPRAATPIAPAVPQAGEPAYYVQPTYPVPPLDAVVRSTATGQVTAKVSCHTPEGLDDVAAAGSQTFFVPCPVFGQKSGRELGTRIYRFRLTSAGEVHDFGLVPGGALTGLDAGDIAAAANGGEIAVVATRTVPFLGRPIDSRVIVIDTKTGRRAVWQDNLGNPALMPDIGNLSLSADGRELAFGAGCSDDVENGCSAERVISPPSRGGKLSDSRVMARAGTLPGSAGAGFQFAAISPDGSTLTVVLLRAFSGYGLPGAAWVVQLSAATGRQLRVLYRIKAGIVSFRWASLDPSGHFLLLELVAETAASRRLVSGWVREGQVIPLPHAGLDAFLEVW